MRCGGATRNSEFFLLPGLLPGPQAERRNKSFWICVGVRRKGEESFIPKSSFLGSQKPQIILACKQQKGRELRGYQVCIVCAAILILIVFNYCFHHWHCKMLSCHQVLYIFHYIHTFVAKNFARIYALKNENGKLITKLSKCLPQGCRLVTRLVKICFNTCSLTEWCFSSLADSDYQQRTEIRYGECEFEQAYPPNW